MEPEELLGAFVTEASTDYSSSHKMHLQIRTTVSIWHFSSAEFLQGTNRRRGNSHSESDEEWMGDSQGAVRGARGACKMRVT